MLDSFPQDAEAPRRATCSPKCCSKPDAYRRSDAREYERTAYDYPLNARSAAAGYAALIAYQKHEPTIAGGESKALWHAQGIESALMFATSFPEHPESARVLTKPTRTVRAQRFRSRDRGVDSRSWRASAGRRDEAAHRATLLAHSLFDRAVTPKPRPPTCACRDSARERPGAPGDREALAASIYKQAEAKRAAGDAAGAVDDFLRVGTAGAECQAFARTPSSTRPASW